MKTNVDQYNTLYMKRTRLKCRGKTIANRKKKKKSLQSWSVISLHNTKQKGKVDESDQIKRLCIKKVKIQTHKMGEILQL